jgi:hypothetical protein
MDGCASLSVWHPPLPHLYYLLCDREHRGVDPRDDPCSSYVQPSHRQKKQKAEPPSWRSGLSSPMKTCSLPHTLHVSRLQKPLFLHLRLTNHIPLLLKNQAKLNFAAGYLKLETGNSHPVPPPTHNKQPATCCLKILTRSD